MDPLNQNHRLTGLWPTAVSPPCVPLPWRSLKGFCRCCWVHYPRYTDSFTNNLSPPPPLPILNPSSPKEQFFHSATPKPPYPHRTHSWWPGLVRGAGGCRDLSCFCYVTIMHHGFATHVLQTYHGCVTVETRRRLFSDNCDFMQIFTKIVVMAPTCCDIIIFQFILKF